MSMTSRERISIAELRAWHEKNGPEVERIWSHEVLALAEAVEAAHDYDTTPATLDMEAAKWAYERMVEKLARFDFGDET